MAQIDLTKIRSVLCVPADDEEKVKKARSYSADLVLFDLEDSVAPDRKNIAREILGRYLDKDCAVRINPVGQGDYYLDRTVAFKAGLIFIPKVETITEIPRDSRNVICIESAAALRNVLPHVDSQIAGVAFGRADFLVSVKGSQSLADRAAEDIAMTAHALRIHASDSPCYVLDDETTFTTEVCRSYAMGFTSKGCFHPSQIETVNRLMRPDPEEVERARSLLGVSSSRPISRSAYGVVSPPVLALARRIAE